MSELKSAHPITEHLPESCWKKHAQHNIRKNRPNTEKCRKIFQLWVREDINTEEKCPAGGSTYPKWLCWRRPPLCPCHHCRRPGATSPRPGTEQTRPRSERASGCCDAPAGTPPHSTSLCRPNVPWNHTARRKKRKKQGGKKREHKQTKSQTNTLG